MKKLASIVAWLLLAVMLVSSLAACDTPEEITTDSKTEETTETVTETHSEKVTEQPTETEKVTETETSDALDTTPLSLEFPVDLFPEYKEYERTESAHMPRVDIRVEAEDAIESTIPWSAVEGGEFSGVLMRALVGGALPLGIDGDYYATFKVTVPVAGAYNISTLSTNVPGMDWTTDYIFEINGETKLEPTDAKKLEDFPSETLNDTNLMKILSFGKAQFNEGENTVRIIIKNEDLNTVGWGYRIALFMDYIDFSLEYNVSEGVEISYDVSLRGQEDSDIISSGAKVNVFDCRYPIKFTINKYFDAASELPYTVKDYFGNVLYEGVISGNEYDMVSLERSIKNHPTGYFTLTYGDVSVGYVVVPSFAERTLEDSPFAMDFAATLHCRDVNNCFNLSCAARLAGVTWVRDRARWTDYEKEEGVYTFGTTEKLFRAIDKSGLKLLVDLCPAPTWVTKPAGYTGNSFNAVGGFANSQLAFYNTCKALIKYYDGVVDAWELWNESDHGFAPETAELFAAWYKAGALGVYDADPDMIVSFGGYCQPDKNLDYVHLSLLNDLLQYTSIFNYHSHVMQPANYSFQTYLANSTMAGHITGTISLYNGPYARPVWVTEAGMRNDKMVYEAYINQANYIVTSTVQSLSIGTDKHFWFLLAPYMEHNGDFGTFSPELEPYPTLAAEAIMTDVLGKAEYLGEAKGLSNDGHGYVFNSGKRIVSVLWSTKEGDRYTIETDMPIIVTDIMGNKTLMEPENGKIQIRLGASPVYVTYSNVPEYYPHDIMDNVMPELSYTLGQRVILSPEFENYDINDPNIKKNGHVISDGLKVKVRVTNLNDVEVKGTVSGTLMGFELVGGEEITVAPFSEGFITLTFKKVSDDPVNTYVTFAGTFNGEETSNATAHVYTEGSEDKGKITFNELSNGSIVSKADLNAITATLEEADGTPYVLLNDKVYENYTFENNVFTIDLSSIEEGRYTLVIAVETDGGDYIYKHAYLTYDGKKAIAEVTSGK